MLCPACVLCIHGYLGTILKYDMNLTYTVNIRDTICINITKHKKFPKKMISIYIRDISFSLHGMNQRNLKLVLASHKILPSILLA
jgi:hypothetical protein